MTYEMFREIVIQKIKDYLPEEWQDATISRIQYEKVNHTNDAIQFVRTPSTEERSIAPNFSVYPWYEEFQQGVELDEVLHRIAHEVIKADAMTATIMNEFEQEKIKENVIFELINTEQNEEYLAHVPHREFQDLSIVYSWILNCEEDSLLSATLTHALASYMGLDEEALFQLAKENTKRLFPTVIRPLSAVMNELVKQVTMENKPIIEVDLNERIYVITNTVRSKGAAAILYEESLYQFAQAYGDDFYLLPSSRHEFVAVPATGMDIERLQDTVYEINQTEVATSDLLSNEMYLYDRQLRAIKQVTDTNRKLIEEKQTETGLGLEHQNLERGESRR